MLIRWFAVALLGLTAACTAQQPPAPATTETAKEGEHYQLLQPPQPTSSGDKIEVIEVFGYWCIHCAHFEPAVEKWKKSLPADVAFSYLPAIFGDGPQEAYARAFYTAETLGVLDKTHAGMFKKAAEERSIRSFEDIVNHYVEAGVSRQEFESTLTSFVVDGKIARAKQILPGYQVEGTPTIIINGKYKVHNHKGGPEDTLRIVDELIARERAARNP